MKLNSLLLSLALVFTGCATTPPPIPSPEKRPTTSTLHGVNRTDNYAYFKDRNSPEMIAHLTAENAYAQHHLKPLKPLASTLYTEILSHIQQTDNSVPYRKGPYLYYTRTIEGQQYTIYCRKPVSATGTTGPEQILLDENVLAKDFDYFSIGGFDISEDNQRVAYAVDTTGFREYRLYIKDLVTGKTTGPFFDRVDSFTFTSDPDTLFVVTQDDAKRPHKLHRFTPGQPPELLFEETDRTFNLFVSSTRSKAYILATSASFDTTEVRLLANNNPRGTFKLVQPRKTGLEYYLDHRPGTFYIRTNDTAPTFRIVTSPESDPTAWTELVPARPDVALSDTDAFKDHLVLSERRGGLPAFTVIDFPRKSAHDITFDEPTYALIGTENEEFNTSKFRFAYTSYLTPFSTYDYDLSARTRTLLKRQPVPGYDPSLYVQQRLLAPASDGTLIPISLVYRKDKITPGTPAPFYLEAYGSYGAPSDPYFSPFSLPALDRGVILATAHIRGGGDFGKPWHNAGKLMNKTNTFTDFIAASEFLIKSNYTTPNRLAITGGSAGGLLMGAVLNLRPDLYQAALLGVPFVDVINTMLDDTLPLTTQEYLEWGNPNEPAAFAYMYTYSPYDNLKPAAYPQILVRTSLNDSQVLVHEPAKWVAKLRETKTDEHPLLMVVNMDAGHGGASGRYDAIREQASDLAWVLSRIGITK